MCRYIVFFICIFLINVSSFALTSDTIEDFENYLKTDYLVERRNYESRFFDGEMLNKRMFNAAEEQQQALQMLLARKNGEVVQIGRRDLATFAAACGKYQWMRDCIIDGDSAIPKNGCFASPLTLVVSGLGDVAIKKTIQERILEVEWFINRYKNILSSVDLMTIHAAAQASGIYGKDEGAMFEHLIHRGLPMTYEELRMLLTIDNSFLIVIKHKLIKKIMKDELEKIWTLYYIGQAKLNQFIHTQ